MRLDFLISNPGNAQFRETDLPKRGMLEGSRSSQVRSRSVSSSLHAVGKIGNEASRSPEMASPSFSEIVANTAAPVDKQISIFTSRAARMEAAAPAIGSGSSVKEGASGRDLNEPVPSAPAQATVVLHTPFGQFDEFSIRPVVDVIAQSPWEVYFVTHAPAEWKYDAASRIQFAAIYGSEALSDVDCHGTVPRNIDPVWVTKSNSDPSAGRG